MLATGAFSRAIAGQDAEWQKIETRYVQLSAPHQILSPGLFDRSIQHMLVLKPPAAVGPNGAAPAALLRPGAANAQPPQPAPVPGAPVVPPSVDIGLPRAGKDAAGNARPPVLLRVASDFVWVDLDGDGKPSAAETRKVNADGYTEPFACELIHPDGSKARYSFCIKTVIENEKYALVRCSARAFDFAGTTITLLDDDGNGKFNDAGRDAVLVDGQPLCFLGKYLKIKDAFFEMIVHASGNSVELRPAPKDMGIGEIAPFEKYSPPQNSENLKLHMLIFSGPEGSFACDETHRSVKVPAGAYDMVFALFDRMKETMYMKAGEKTSFAVTANQQVQPKWGGKIKIKIALTSDGEEVTLTPPRFFGQMTEEYLPDSARLIPCTARIALVYRDKTHFDTEGYQQFGAKKYEVLGDNLFKPLQFKRYRTQSEEYEAYVEYTSGIIGRVEGKERLAFVYKRKEVKTP